jgi:predicted enzyme related to lactoylglutathione lyase
MGKRDSYAPGTFCWVDLSTTDPAAAKSFYGELLGWEAEDMPTGDGGTYTMVSIDGDSVAALQDQPAQQREAGIPPYWFSYISVASADETAAKAKELGATVHMDAFDVLDVGRMAVIADPTGAMFGAWEPRRHPGAARVNDPGCLAWNELSTNDVAATKGFYSELFGWEMEDATLGGGPPYTVIHHDGAASGHQGGIRELAPEQARVGIPPHWIPYFTVESADDAAAKVKDGGGQVHAGPMDIAQGRIAVAADPQGATFALFQGDVDD